MNKNSALYKELVLRDKIMECCKACRHFTVRLDDDYCMKHDAWIYGCTCQKKKKYLARFGLNEQDLDWDIFFLDTTDDDFDFT